MRTIMLMSVFLLSAFLAAGCEQDSPIENAAEGVEEAADEAQDSVEEVGDELEDAAEEIDNPQ